MKKFRRILRRCAPICIALLLAAVSVGSYVHAKYVKSQTLSAQLTVKAEIGEIKVLEHRADRQPDGSYALDTSVSVDKAEYILLPGLDVPKDPFVVVTKPNDLPVYVYVEIVSTLPETVTFAVSSDWTELSGITGPNGGRVYVYKDVITASQTALYILEGNTVNVSQELLHGTTTGLGLDFYAYMYQTAAGNDADSVYKYYNK